MLRFVPALLAALALGAGPTQAQDDSPITTVKDLVARMQARGEKVQSASLRMLTRGTYPGGVSFQIEGSVRVLGTTHFHVTSRATFEDEVTSESETVKTPDGVWMREKDPAQGELFLRMDQALADRLEQAERTLAEAGGSAGALQGSVKDPLGSAMLASLEQQFDLQLERRVIDGRDMLVVHGPLRAGAPAPEDPEMPVPDRIELLVRTPDLAVVRMTQFQAGEELMQVEIKDLELDRPLDKASFRLDLPEGGRWMDVLEHPPAAAQIQHTLERAREKAAEKKGEPGK